MPNSVATISTPNASRYLQQLCKHFGHKVPVEFTPEKGQVTLPFGVCRMLADPDGLTLTLNSDIADLPRLERVLGDHLARFAFREHPNIQWQRAA